MGLLLSVLVTCVGVLEVIACYTHFRIGIAYNECKSNIRDIAKYYAVELRKHELRFETPPPDADRVECSTSTSTVRVQEPPDHNLHTHSNSSDEPDSSLSVSATHNPAAHLKVPRNSISGLDSPTIQQLSSPEVNISQIIASKLQDHENDDHFWTRKSPSPLEEKTNLCLVEKDFWKSRSPSPFPQNNECEDELVYTPGLRRPKPSLSPILKAPMPIPNNVQSFVADSNTIYIDTDNATRSPDLHKYPSLTDLEVQQILNVTEESNFVPRQPSPYPDVLLGLADNQEPKFDEDFLRSLDGVKSPKCDDKRRNFRKKRNSSSTSSRASRDETRSLTSLDEIDSEQTKRSGIYFQQQSIRSDITPLLEEVSAQCPITPTEVSQNVIHAESVISEKYDAIKIPEPPLAASVSQQPIIVTKHEKSTDKASVLPTSAQEQERAEAKSETGKSGAEVSFTEKVKDLEISVQLMVTVKGASSGDKMKYTTNLSPDVSKQNSVSPKPIEEITTSTEESGEFGHLITNLTVGGNSSPANHQDKIEKRKLDHNEIPHASASTNGFHTEEEKNNLKELQISSQSLICSERASMQNAENEAVKLYESFNELPDVEKNKFLRFIGRSKVIEEIEKIDGKKEKIPKHEERDITTNQCLILESEESSQKNKPTNILCEASMTEKITSEKTQGTDNATTKNEDITHEETKTDEKEKETTVFENKHIPKETFSTLPIDEKKIDSSESSSETPSTAIENLMRRASQTSFEEASLSQNEAMLQRRLSNSEISSQQASQAFWLIFSAEYTNAMEKDWHGQHFSCWQCDESLTGQRYVLRDEHPYCVRCYEQVFANTCEKCNRIIGIDSKDLSYKEKHWHEACFQCTTCSESLVDKQFGAKGEKIYCGNCYDKQFASRCDGCGKIFHAGTKKMEYKNRQWHEQCFKCCKCETPIGTKSFIPREKDIYCAGCYEEKFATRCIKCDKAIQSGGVTYKNEPWHRECFTCAHCDKNLAGQRFTSRDDKPCCAECFGRLFAKRCTSCKEPITGIGGTRFISFEDRHWHNDCFICASCSTSLVGRGFITDQDKIICPDCAKERFM